jgi:isopentenyl phosphate kinase
VASEAPGPVVVKLGGSVITRKRENERRRPKVLLRLGLELGRPPVPRLIVLHGAGSFGHPGARKFGLARPPDEEQTEAERRRGGAIVGREVRRLHLEVLRALIDAGVPAYSVPASGLARNSAGRLTGFEDRPFREAIAEGRVPVAFGDVVPDDAWGVSILSADVLALELARRLRAERVVFVSDVPGILPTPRDRREHLSSLVRPPAGPDVTGGIRRKAEVMLELAGLGIPVGLVNGLSMGAAGRALRGPTGSGGTWAMPARPAP